MDAYKELIKNTEYQEYRKLMWKQYILYYIVIGILNAGIIASVIFLNANSMFAVLVLIISIAIIAFSVYDYRRVPGVYYGKIVESRYCVDDGAIINEKIMNKNARDVHVEYQVDTGVKVWGRPVPVFKGLKRDDGEFFNKGDEVIIFYCNKQTPYIIRRDFSEKELEG